MLLLSLLVLCGFVPAPHDCAPAFVPSENNSNHEEVALVRRRSFQPLFIGGLLAGLGGGGAPAPPPPPAQAPAGQAVPGGKGAKAADTAVTAIGASENIMSSVFDAMNPMNMIRPWMKVASTVANGAGAVTDKVITNHVDPNKEPQQTQSQPQPQPQPQPHLDSEELPEEEIEEAFDDEYEDDSTYEDDTMYEEEMNYPSAEPNTAPAQQDFVNNPTSLDNLNKADTANDNSPTGNLSKQTLILIIVGSICFTVLIVAIIVGCIIGNKVKSNSTGNEKNIFEIITSNAGPGDFSYMNLNNPIAATTTFNANDLSNTCKPPIMANDL